MPVAAGTHLKFGQQIGRKTGDTVPDLPDRRVLPVRKAPQLPQQVMLPAETGLRRPEPGDALLHTLHQPLNDLRCRLEVPLPRHPADNCTLLLAPRTTVRWNGRVSTGPGHAMYPGLMIVIRVMW